jgi:hypothetical protein
MRLISNDKSYELFNLDDTRCAPPIHPSQMLVHDRFWLRGIPENPKKTLEAQKWTNQTLLTRVKMLRLMQYWWKQDWTMFCCPHCSQLSTILNNIVTPDSGSTTLFNIVDKCEQRGQQNIVQSCWATGSAFFAVYQMSFQVQVSNL